MARGDNPDFRQSSFAGGEVSPLMYGRSDFKKYQTSLKSCMNWVITQQGALLKRPGTQFIQKAYQGGGLPSTPVRLIPFIFSNSQALVIEAGAGYFRFYQNGLPIVSGGIPVAVATPYAAADVFRLKFAQSGDVITFVHPNYAPQDLKRLTLDGTQWSMAATAFTPFTTDTSVKSFLHSMPMCVYFAVDANANFDFNAGGSNSLMWSYAVTAVYDDGSESLPVSTIDRMIDRTGAMKYRLAWSMDLTVSRRPSYFNVYLGRSGTWGLLDTVGGETGIASGSGFYWYYADGGGGADFAQNPPSWPTPFYNWPMGGVYALGTFYPKGFRLMNSFGNMYECVEPGIAVKGEPTITAGTYLDGPAAGFPFGLNSVLNAYYQFSGAVWQATFAGPEPADGTNNALWSEHVTPIAYGSSHSDGNTSWKHIAPGGFCVWKFVQTGQPPVGQGEWPSVVTYSGQRKVFANTPKDPGRFVGSRIGHYFDYNQMDTPLDTDEIDFSLASERYEEIRSFIQLKVLLALTSEKDWSISGAGGGRPTPAGILAQPNNVRGSSWLDPLVVGVSGLYVQALGTQIWELVFDFYTQSYLGNDLTIQAQHLFQRHKIVDWGYAPVPYSLVWAVREDGTLLGCTYVREQEVAAWHHHTTQGTFESVCCIPETINGIAETGVYVSVARTSQGVTTRYIERFASRTLPATYDAQGLPTEDTSRGVFLDAAVAGGIGESTIVTGLNHLEGMQVMALADGVVYGPYTVTGGQIDMTTDLGGPGSANWPGWVIVGLAYNSDAEMLPLAPDNTQIRSNHKAVYRVSFEVVGTRGLYVGPDFNTLQEWAQRQVNDSYGSVAPFTGLDHIRIDHKYDHDGRIVIRHSDPLPATILALAREVNIGGD
jgi:hypothetical protein